MGSVCTCVVCGVWNMGMGFGEVCVCVCVRGYLNKLYTCTIRRGVILTLCIYVPI